MPLKPRLLILTGTTASGKSNFIYDYLKTLPISVINADSRQVYRDLKISSASPTPRQLLLFPHYLYNFLPLDATFSAGAFIRMAKEAIAHAHGTGRIPVLCGGTYFYIHSLLQGLLPEIPVPDDIQSHVAKLSDDEAWQQFHAIDAVAAQRVHPHNRVRLNRQLALCLAHGGPISNLARSGGIQDDFEILMLVFAPSRTILQQRVTARVAQMFAEGIIDEAQIVFHMEQEKHLDWRLCPALSGIGIREFFEYYQTTKIMPLQLSVPERAAVAESIVRNTMQLIKRQMTWFRNAAEKPVNTKTVDPSYEPELIAALLREFIQVRAP